MDIRKNIAIGEFEIANKPIYIKSNQVETYVIDKKKIACILEKLYYDYCCCNCCNCCKCNYYNCCNCCKYHRRFR